MRYILTALALTLAACGPGGKAPTPETQAASAVTTAANTVNSRSSVNSSSSVNANTSNTVTSSTNSGTGGTSSTTVTQSTSNDASTCSTEVNGRRCEISCKAPRVAHCDKSDSAAAPSCYCS